LTRATYTIHRPSLGHIGLDKENIGAVHAYQEEKIMTSGNAFRDGEHGPMAATYSPSNGDTGYACKRRKLLPPLQASIFRKTGDPSVSLEVDHMILDYLSYETTEAVLESRMSRDMSSSSVQHKVVLVDTFIEMFKAKHPTFQPDPELRFRLLLLKFATLYSYRLIRAPIVPSKPALRHLRETNTSRAVTWIHSADRMPSSKHNVSAFEAGSGPDQDSRRAQTLSTLNLPAEDEAYEDAFYGTPECLALLDLLPLFMSVIAARNELNNSNLSKGLMELAAQFMLQACLEQYLIRGANGCDAIDEAFAWGFKPGEFGPDFADLTNEVDRMFQDEDDHSQEITGWSEVKSCFVAELVHDDTDVETLGQHLENVADAYPIDTFEETVLQLLTGLAASLPSPVLTQLEQGSLDGMSSAETETFLENCGLDEHWPVMSN
jgi:hypothetical protein